MTDDATERDTRSGARSDTAGGERLGWIASSRMYDVSPAIRAHWHTLLRWASRRAGVPLRLVEHAAPAPLDALWSTPRLGAVFMCGYPFATRTERPVPIAAPVPAPARHGDRPTYVCDIVVRRDSEFSSLDDTFAGRLGWTVEHSYSGYHALRHHLASIGIVGGSPFRATVGPLGTPRRALAALSAGEVDVIAVDGYFFDLVGRHLPEVARAVKVVATTSAAPIPLLVASPDIAPSHASELTRAFLAAGDDATLRPTLDALLLKRFDAVCATTYEELARRAGEADGAGIDFSQPDPRDNGL